MQKQEMQSGSAEKGRVESKAAQGIYKILQLSRTWVQYSLCCHASASLPHVGQATFEQYRDQF